jgi:FkbM family methyltransferase
MTFTLRHILKALLVGTMRILTWPLGKSGRRRLLRILRQGMNTAGFDEVVAEIPTPRGATRFYCLGDLPLWRAQTLLTKEPETIEWIDTIADDHVLYDIGANVGVYTVYAAINRKVRVLAFEPLAANYFLLNRNIEENRLSDTVSAYCLALNDSDIIDKFHVRDTGFGSALSSFAEAIDHNGEPFQARFEQGMLGMTLDGFIEKFDPPFPDHIKIDVDGIEDKIVTGAARTLADPRVKSLSIELDAARPDYTDAVVRDIEAAGLSLVSKRRAPELDGTPFGNIYNYLFRRNAEAAEPQA